MQGGSKLSRNPSKPLFYKENNPFVARYKIHLYNWLPLFLLTPAESKKETPEKSLFSSRWR